ncbi:MAG TPA: DUF5678 domain-containing protein, partial [Blastocatellia bacterium]|nr:DUF5678 domain-containing protein [Blastocatellia bacterium]
NREEQQELLEALYSKASRLKPGAYSRGKVRYTGEVIDNSRENKWIEEHRAEYLGLWVALSGDRLLSSGTDARKVYEEARAAGEEAPYLARIGPSDELPWGGW